ncbi:MAG: DegQ family serine endoprotease [Gammaproteobacteria bacterium]|nr:DegQ family serine endoprotease [Gammaproteobacteria bacterium]
MNILRSIGWCRVSFLLVLVGLILLPQISNAAELPDFTKLVEDNGPAVVNISTTQKAQAKSNRRLPPNFPENGPNDDWFKHYFGEDGVPGGDGGMPRSESLGSGFVISKDGYILTNNHVIDGADKIIVRLSDRRELEAELVGTDPRADLALLKIKANNLSVVKIGRSKDLKVGEWVLAIGSPFGFDYSVTSGIVSAKKRALPRESYVPFIQTDVAINPGNSGGPLFNLQGEVVGINSQIYSRTGGYMGLSFAIPIDVAMNVVEQLKSKGHVTRGWLGVLIQDVTRELAESFKMDKPQGALVARVLPSSPAEKAGLQVGDIVLSFNGHEIDHSSDLPPMVGITEVNKSAPMEIIRDGKKRTVSVTIGELPEEEEKPARVSKKGGDKDAGEQRLGLELKDIDDEMRSRLELSAKGGVLVADVKSSAARQAGVRRGDVILKIDRQNVKNLEGFIAIVDKLEDGRVVPLLVSRRGSPIFLALRVGEE